MNACGHPDCCSSTGIHEGLTFGRGKLDEYGYWAVPCRTCAEDFDRRQPNLRRKIAHELLAEGKGKRYIRKFMAMCEWLRYPAWPYKEEK